MEMRFLDKEQLIKELRKGDQDAFSYLFHKYYKKLYKISLLLVCDPDTANDIVQELFITLWSKRDLLKDADKIENYLYISVRNNSYKYVSRRQDQISITECLDIVSEHSNSTLTVTQQEEIWRHVNELPERCREILKLVVFADMTYHEVAATLNVSVNTIKTQMKIGYKQLRERLKPECYLYLLIFGAETKGVCVTNHKT